MRGTFSVRFEGVNPVTTCEYPIDWGRDLVAAMRKAIPEARAAGGVVEVTFPRPGGGGWKFALLPEEAEERAKGFEESIARALLQQQRGAAHPLGKVEVITRDDKGEMVKVETTYKF